MIGFSRYAAIAAVARKGGDRASVFPWMRGPFSSTGSTLMVGEGR